jgi:hypothetical protein
MFTFRAALPSFLAVILVLTLTNRGRADAFDDYTNPLLVKAAESDAVKEMKQVTPDDLLNNDRVLKGVDGAMLIVKTNGGRNAKLLVHPAAQKTDATHSVPTLLIDRYVTYKEGEERTLLATGKNLALFPGFRLSLDMGQVVPEELGGDLRFIVDGDKSFLEPVGKAKLYLLTKALPEATPKKTEKVVIGEKFEPRYFNGKYKLSDDGRRSGELVLKVDDDGSVSGSYYSDKDGQKYDLRGKVGTPDYSIQFTVQFPRAEQTFQGWLFTGDGKHMAGSSRMNEREAGFYATRIEE